MAGALVFILQASNHIKMPKKYDLISPQKTCTRGTVHKGGRTVKSGLSRSGSAWQKYARGILSHGMLMNLHMLIMCGPCVDQVGWKGIVDCDNYKYIRRF